MRVHEFSVHVEARLRNHCAAECFGRDYRVDERALYAKLTEIFREVLEDDEIVLTPQLTADETRGWESLKHVRLMLTVERGFGVKIATSEMIRVKNVGDLAQLIGQKLSLRPLARV